MTEEKQEKKMEISVEYSGIYIAIALLIIFFGGEPDLIDALIHWLMK